jgi:hypothetical protein
VKTGLFSLRAQRSHPLREVQQSPTDRLLTSRDTHAPTNKNTCYHEFSMATKQTRMDPAAELAGRLSEALQRERLVPRFVDSYVVEHGRYGLQVHAALYRDLLALLQREALIAASVRALEIATEEPQSSGGKPQARPMLKKDAAAYRRKYLGALARHEGWTAGDALDFQRDFQIYEELIARTASARRRKPFEAANHPFVDRSAFLLDSSFLEKARVAASRALNDIEGLAGQVLASISGTDEGKSPARKR